MIRMLTAAVLSLGLLASPALAAGDCEKKADEKKLAGAARTSFVKKCQSDNAAATACEASAKEKKLAGAAKNSHVKKCMEEAAAKTS
jgi:hypothetical protein